ncbi:DUF6192 family protein [Streptomyces sp. CA-251247]|uniref:DUF6192 family protein n=1 Tax=Streptomyces sp. CA-251247 TaxID=3240062 RepID=UPI003D8FD7E5
MANTPTASAASFTAALRDRQLSDDKWVIVHENAARVWARFDWIETAVVPGKVDMDEKLARLL